MTKRELIAALESADDDAEVLIYIGEYVKLSEYTADLEWSTHPVERVNIDNDGNVLIMEGFD